MKTREQIVDNVQDIIDRVCDAGLDAEQLEQHAERIGDSALALEIGEFRGVVAIAVARLHKCIHAPAKNPR